MTTPLSKKPATYGPSSTIIPSARFSGTEWIPYAAPPLSGSTFFVGNGRGSGSNRGMIAARNRPSLPVGMSGRSNDSNTTIMNDAFERHFPERDLLPDEPPRPLPRLPARVLGPRPQPPSKIIAPPSPVATPTRLPFIQSSSILVHSGFWNILAATGSRFYGMTGGNILPQPVVDDREDVFDEGYLGLKAAESRRAVTNPTSINAAVAVQKKRVSIDQIGRPREFAHLLHASNYEQGEQLLRRWHADGIGKLAQPAWVEVIKNEARQRARALGIAQIQANRDEEAGSLKVINASKLSGNSSVDAVENESIQSPPLFTRMNTAGTVVIRNEPPPRPTIDGLPSSLSSPVIPDFDYPIIRDSPIDAIATTRIVPSLITIERAVATKVYFETYYHGIFKKASSRDKRQTLLERELTRLNITDAERRNVRAAWLASETEHLRELRTRVRIEGFQKLVTIGHGAFGVVSLVREKVTGELYAMKQLRKADMLRKLQEGHIRAEKDLLESASGMTRWIVRLAYSFQDVDHLYLVMEYMAGGDLLNLLIERDVFPEDFAKFYIAEMVLAIEETHKTLGAIHRDIKPDNFLFDSSGHLKISDFGLATDFHWSHDGQYYDQQRKDLLRKHGIDLEDGTIAPATGRFDRDRVNPRDRDDEAPGSMFTWRDKNRRRLAYSVVGTNNYMSVEVLRGQGYDQACDWWSCGVIAFEMLYGYPPFVSKSRNITRQKIMSWRTSLRFPSRPKISREAQNFIEMLICEKEDRLGSRSASSGSTIGRRGGLDRGLDKGMMEGAEDLKAHPWFKGIDFATIHEQTPPFVPELSEPGDTRYFEDDIDPNPLAAPDAAGVNNPEATKDPMLKGEHGSDNLMVRKEMGFKGWTFKRTKNMVYDPRHGILSTSFTPPASPVVDENRGRSSLKVQGGSGFSRSLSV